MTVSVTVPLLTENSLSICENNGVDVLKWVVIQDLANRTYTQVSSYEDERREMDPIQDIRIPFTLR